MTRSIFDPSGGETERSGSRNLGPDAGNLSHLPPDITDGKTDDSADEQVLDVESQRVPSVSAPAQQHRPCRESQ